MEYKVANKILDPVLRIDLAKLIIKIHNNYVEGKYVFYFFFFWDLSFEVQL